jgi:hypothetical protein
VEKAQTIGAHGMKSRLVDAKIRRRPRFVEE